MITAFFTPVSVDAQQIESFDKKMQRIGRMIENRQLVAARPGMLELKEANLLGGDQLRQVEFFIALSYVFEYYKNKDDSLLNKAKESFEDFIEKYPESNLADFARYNLGDILATRNQVEAALKKYIPLYRDDGSKIDKRELLQKIVLLYVAAQKWEAGIPYFEDSLELAKDQVDRTTAAAYLVIARAKKGELEDAQQLLDFFTNPAPIFFSPRFNKALMEVGDQLKESGDLTTASLFFQFVRSYETLESGLKNYIASLEQRVERFEDSITQRQRFIEAQSQLLNAKAELEALETSPNYTPLIRWRIAQIYMELGREYEAFWLFRKMVDGYPDHEQAESILYSAISLAYDLGKREEAIALSRNYLERPDYDEHDDTVTDRLASHYFEEKDFEELFALTGRQLERSPDSEATRQVLFKHGMLRLNRLESRELIEEFIDFERTYGDTASGTVIRYFLGVGNLLRQNNAAAIDYFQAVAESGSPKFEADVKFRIAVATMGLDRLKEAEEKFLDFIKTYPSSGLRPTAELTLGNLYDMRGQRDTALEHYKKAIELTDQVATMAQAELQIAQLLRYSGGFEKAVGRLETFGEQHSSNPAVIPVIDKLAELYTEDERLRDANRLYTETIRRFYDRIGVDEVDSLLVAYLETDAKLRRRQAATEAFFKEVRGSPELLFALVEDRARQFRYFQDHPDVDPLVEQHFVRDNSFRNDVMEALTLPPPAPSTTGTGTNEGENDNSAAESEAKGPRLVEQVPRIPALGELERELRRLNRSLPAVSAVDWCREQLRLAREKTFTALEVRMEAALASTAEPREEPKPKTMRLVNDSELWPNLSNASKLWILEAWLREAPDRVIAELDGLRMAISNTNNEYDFLSLLARAHEATGALDQAAETYDQVIDRYASKSKSSSAFLAYARIRQEQGRFEEAREVLERILQRPEWRGRLHAQALLALGRSYFEEGKYPEAHGFFERIMLGYPGFSEELAMAFYEDLRTLERMGEEESVATVLDAFEETPGLEGTRGAGLIQKAYQ